MKILIVEDSKVINNTLAQKLRIKGHLCVQSFSVRDINEALKDNCFDLVILDLHLPDGEGVEVFDLFKNQEETKIIIYTADENLDARTYFFQNGAIDYLTKNSSADKLLSDVDEIINRLENNRLNNILIVDDSVVVRKQLSQIFKVRNFNVFTASDKREARELAEKHDITFAIVDLILPDGNGEVLINNLRKMEKYSKLPIIAISSMSDPNVIKSVYKSGASDFLKKPIVFEELILKVNLWIDIINKDIKSKHNEQLLNEYKKAIDNSEIISKTDTKGVITYVNDKFCQISGYTPEELMGKPHNIIRHPDMESETFAGLWKMILNKETWRGTVKNMAKDGSAYWVDSTITPILDINGDISEFIAVRHDVTKIEAMKEELQDKLQMSSKNLWEMLAINTSYENAIGASNILSRTDTKGIITFVNEEIAKVSGYKASEVVGKSHNVIKHPDNNEDFYKNIWKTIKSNNIFRGVIKNRARDGKTFYAATTIVPIMNANEEILEYMAIRNDVTEIFELTDELQKHSMK